MDNGPAKAARSSYLLQEAGERVGDMIEISTIRREDYAFVKSMLIIIYSTCHQREILTEMKL